MPAGVRNLMRPTTAVPGKKYSHHHREWGKRKKNKKPNRPWLMKSNRNLINILLTIQRIAWTSENLYTAGQKLTAVRTGKQIHPLTLHATMCEEIKRPIESHPPAKYLQWPSCNEIIKPGISQRTRNPTDLWGMIKQINWYMCKRKQAFKRALELWIRSH